MIVYIISEYLSSVGPQHVPWPRPRRDGVFRPMPQRRKSIGRLGHSVHLTCLDLPTAGSGGPSRVAHYLGLGSVDPNRTFTQFRTVSQVFAQGSCPKNSSRKLIDLSDFPNRRSLARFSLVINTNSFFSPPTIPLAGRRAEFGVWFR